MLFDDNDKTCKLLKICMEVDGRVPFKRLLPKSMEEIPSTVHPETPIQVHSSLLDNQSSLFFQSEPERENQKFARANRWASRCGCDTLNARASVSTNQNRAFCSGAEVLLI